MTAIGYKDLEDFLWPFSTEAIIRKDPDSAPGNPSTTSDGGAHECSNVMTTLECRKLTQMIILWPS